MRTRYIGVRWAGAVSIKINNRDDLPIRHDIRHFADSMDWGCRMPEAEQLALALLCHRFGVRIAQRYCRTFARRIVERLPIDDWKIEGEWLDRWL